MTETQEPRLSAEEIIHAWLKGRISASLRDGMLRKEGYELKRDYPRPKGGKGR